MPEKTDRSTEDPVMRAVALLSPVLLVLLLVLAVVFYKERMLYIDAPHTLFRIMNDGRLHIEENRYGSFISQAFPWLGIKMHLPLKALMILYSVGFYLFYLTVALLLVYKFRNYGLAVLLGLYFTVFVSDTFYWPNNEVHQGIAWLMLAFAVNFSAAGKRPALLQLFLFAGLFFLALWTHPLVMLAAVYLWFFFAANKDTFPYTRMQSIFFSVLLLVMAYAKYYQGLHHGYDSSKMESLATFDINSLKGVLSSTQLRFFTHSCLTHYWLFNLLSLAGLAGLLVGRRYLLFAWTVLFSAGYLVLTCITFRDAISRSYMESEYAPLVIICCAPFVYYVLPKMKPKMAVSLFAAVYCIRIIFILMAASSFTYRVAVLEHISAKMKEKHLTKVIIPEPLPEGTEHALIMNWAAPVESIFISKLNGEMPQRTFIFLSAERMKDFNTASKDTLLGSWEKRAAVNINGRYVQIDTTTTYQVINYASLMN